MTYDKTDVFARLSRDIKRHDDQIDAHTRSKDRVLRKIKDMKEIEAKYGSFYNLDIWNHNNIVVTNPDFKPTDVKIVKSDKYYNVMYYLSDKDLKRLIYFPPGRKTIAYVSRSYLEKTLIVNDYSICEYPWLKDKQIELAEKAVKKLILLNPTCVLRKDCYNLEKWKGLVNFR